MALLRTIGAVRGSPCVRDTGRSCKLLAHQVDGPADGELQKAFWTYKCRRLVSTFKQIGRMISLYAEVRISQHPSRVHPVHLEELIAIPKSRTILPVIRRPPRHEGI